MIEIYLFVNPIGPICYQSELTLLDALSDQRKKEKIQLHILPIMNLHTVGISGGLPFNGSIRSRIA